jgi:uncharacterized membrane protein
MITSLQIIASFLLAFKSVLIEGTEITILSLATLKLIGGKNVALGLTCGLVGTVLIYSIVSRIFLIVTGQHSLFGLSDGGVVVIDLVAGAITLFFSWRFLKEFVKDRRTRSSFGEAMKDEEEELISREEKVLIQEHLSSERRSGPRVPTSFRLSLPVLGITLSEGFEASLVVSAATAYSP